MECQVGRLVSDAESEKRTRAVVNSELRKEISEIREAIQLETSLVKEIHVALFGAGGVGGLHRWVTEINQRVSATEKSQEHMTGKVLGVALGCSAILTLLAFLAAYFFRK